MSLQRALLTLIVAALLAGILPAAVALDRLLARELEARAREEVARSPRLLVDHDGAVAEALRMHALEVARAPGLAEALESGDRERALRTLETARGSFADRAIVVSARGEVWTGPAPTPAMIDATRHGNTPMGVLPERDALHRIALAPVLRDGVWSGAAGVTLPLDETLAGTLAALVQCEVVILGENRRIVAASDKNIGATIADYAAPLPRDGQVHKVEIGGVPYLIASADLGDNAAAVFVTDLRHELAMLPKLRRVVVLGAGLTLVLGLLLGSLLAADLARPVRSLAAAADRLAEGDFTAPLESSAIREVDRLAHAFRAMRRALAGRLEELQAANRELADRQERLTALQWELLQRERLAASGRLVAELAHEIRNPVASVRNCLELIDRRLTGDPEGREFARMAIDELLRMHELAERMLDLNRPRAPGALRCDAAAVAREIAALTRVGVSGETLVVTITGDREAPAAIVPDTLKQVLLNLVQNARDARPHGLKIDIVVRCEPSLVSVEVLDNGPGVPPEILPRVFDPFFTTKGTVGGIGLGLFVAELIIRTHGGRITVCNRDDGNGACFRVELVPVGMDAPELPDPSDLPETVETAR